MEPPQKQPAKSNAPQPQERIPVERRVSATRCPYCHDDAGPEDDALACRACLARHHVACWEESGSCGSCGGDQALRAQAEATRAPLAPRTPTHLHPGIRGLLIALGIGVLLLLVVSEVRKPVTSLRPRPWGVISLVVFLCFSSIAWGKSGRHP